MNSTADRPEPNVPYIEKLIKQRIHHLVDMAGTHCDNGDQETAQFLLNEAQQLALTYDNKEEFLWMAIL